MATYLRFYHLESPPFSGDSKKSLVLGTRSLRAAMVEIKQGIADGSPRICLSGSEGIGKTSLCRALPKLLAEDATVVSILNPQRPWNEIRAIIAKKLGLPGGAVSRKTLLGAYESTGKRLVLVFDQAELLPHEVLDHLDILLQYKDEGGEQLLHCVMLANLEPAATGAEVPLLWWLDKLTTLQLQFSPIPPEGIRHYVRKHLAKAGWSGDDLFDEQACQAIYRNTGGIPRAINEICERALLEAGVRALQSIDCEFIEALCADTLADPSAYRAQPDPQIPDSISERGGDSFSLSAQELLDHTPDRNIEPAPREPAPPPRSEPRPPRRPQPATVRSDAERFGPRDEALDAALAASGGTSSTADEQSSGESVRLELANEPLHPHESQSMLVPRMTATPPPPRSMTGSRPIQRPHRRRRSIPLFSALLLVALGVVALMQYTGRLDLLAMLPTNIDPISPRLRQVAPKLAEITPKLPKLEKLPGLPGAKDSASSDPESRTYRKHSILDDADMTAAPVDLESALDANTRAGAESDDLGVPAVFEDAAVTDSLDTPEGQVDADPESGHLAHGAPTKKAERASSPPAASAQEDAGALGKRTAASRTPTPAPAPTAAISQDLVIENEYTALPETTRQTPVAPPAMPAPGANAPTKATPSPETKIAPVKTSNEKPSSTRPSMPAPAAPSGPISEPPVPPKTTPSQTPPTP